MIKLRDAILQLRKNLLHNGELVSTGNWQGKQDKFEFIELQHIALKAELAKTVEEAREQCEPFTPWADMHFEERVSGVPHNPPPSHTEWLKGTEKFLSGDKFSHSYPERMWSKGLMPRGIRYAIGDLNTAVEILKQQPTTRQCYIPIWFPEDLDAAHKGERVPCTFGWHLMIRDNKLSVHYPMRSCDAIRHFHNDLYLANRLALWMVDQLKEELPNLTVGNILFTCSSFHCFSNDKYPLQLLTGEM